MWKCAQGALPIGESFTTRQINIDPKCKRCGELESVAHLIFHCDFAKQVWKAAPFAKTVELPSHFGFKDGWMSIKKPPAYHR